LANFSGLPEPVDESGNNEFTCNPWGNLSTLNPRI
jgi:hypothetical protein